MTREESRTVNNPDLDLGLIHLERLGDLGVRNGRLLLARAETDERQQPDLLFKRSAVELGERAGIGRRPLAVVGEGAGLQDADEREQRLGGGRERRRRKQAVEREDRRKAKGELDCGSRGRSRLGRGREGQVE